jgi:hypothetical protein
MQCPYVTKNINCKKIILVTTTFGRLNVISLTITLPYNFHLHDMVDHIILTSFFKIHFFTHIDTSTMVISKIIDHTYFI